MTERVVGIDLAAKPKKTYACVIEPAGDALRARLHRSCDDITLFELARDCAKVGIDAPFGWPSDFVDALVAHRRHEAWPAPDDGQPDAFRASLSFRATDRVTAHTRRPLSVSTDKLGVTAMRCAYLLHRWSKDGPIDRTGAGKFVEVYPAGALKRWKLNPGGYKGSGGGTSLQELLRQLLELVPVTFEDADDESMCRTNDDAFDALVAALVSRAAAVGLTSGPPEPLRQRAQEEGWIHLPVRGSARFLTGLRGTRPADALAARLREAGVTLDARGYATRFEDVLLPTFAAETRDAIVADLTGKGGGELTGPSPKFHAAHSSAALAANTFGPFLRERRGLPFAGVDYDGVAQLERECSTGLGGTPPTLDCVIEGKAMLAVESKCLEPFARHTAHFASSYSGPMEEAHRTWRDEYTRLVEEPTRYRYLDAAQLIKHYLGVRRSFAGRDVVLAYLYWEPANATDLASCVMHAAEVEEFVSNVDDPKIKFVARSHRDLWREWSLPAQPVWLRDHAATLQRRYDVNA